MRYRPNRALVMTLAPALAVASGCAQRGDLLGFLSAGAEDGGAGDAATAGDGPAVSGAPRFAPPQLVAALSDPTADDEDPTFTGDRRELYFSSDRAGTSDIWVSRRASAADPWGAPSLVTELSSPSIDRSPSVSLDGLTMWFTTDRDTTRGRIWRSSRASTLVPWSTPVPVIELASSAFDTAPSVDATETTMFFSSFRSGFPSYDIYSSTRPSVAAPWSAPLRVPGLDTPADEADPFVAQGGLVVFFTLSRGPMGQGDLYWSARRSTDAPFPLAFPVADVNSPFPDSDAALSPDLLYLMFASSRSGNFEIYETYAVN